MDPHLHLRCCRPVDLSQVPPPPLPQGRAHEHEHIAPLALALVESLGQESLRTQRAALRESQKLNKKLSTHLDQTLLLLRDMVMRPSPKREKQGNPHEAREGREEVNLHTFPAPKGPPAHSRQGRREWRSRTPIHRNTSSNWRQTASSQTTATEATGATSWVAPVTAANPAQQPPIGSERRQKNEAAGNASTTKTQK